MKLSQKLKEKIKKNLTIALVICAAITSTLATMKLADFSMPLNNTVTTTQASQSLLSDTQNSSNEITIAADGAIVCDSIVQGVRA